MSYLLGIDIGGTKCAVISARWNGDIMEIIGRREIATDTAISASVMLERLFCLADEILEKAPDRIGISCGGPLDAKRGIILSPPNLPGWDRVPVTELAEARFRAPARLCNDANASAIAEHRFGAGRGYSNVIFLTFGTGLGAGLILDGKLYEGTNGNAGEIGHIRLAPNGPIGYGKAGSFEGFCSGGGIARMANARMHNTYTTSTAELACAANEGDSLALEIFRNSAQMLGTGLSILIDTLNPEIIIIGSVFAKNESLFRDEMERVIEREALEEARSVCRIVPSALGNSIGDYAALACALIGGEENV